MASEVRQAPGSARRPVIADALMDSPRLVSAAGYDALRRAPGVPAARRRSRAGGEVLRHDVLPAHPIGHQIAELPGEMEAVAPVERGGVLVVRHHRETQHAR